MSEQEKVRKYMIRDIVRHNMKYLWIIVICLISIATILGYKKNKANEARFANMKATGTTYQVGVTLYCGNVNSSSVYTRVDDVRKLLESNNLLLKQHHLHLTQHKTGCSKKQESFSLSPPLTPL